jgi:predicted nucleic acid-binding protein
MWSCEGSRALRGWLLDTNVVSELRKPRPNPRVRSFVAAQPAHLLFLSTITLAEVRYGIERLADAARRRDITLWLERTLRPLFAGRVLDVSEDVVLRWRQMLEAGRQRGHTFGQPDLSVAAIAALEALVVVSRDIREFVAAGVPVLDPWTGVYTAASGDPMPLSELAHADLLDSIDAAP